MVIHNPYLRPQLPPAPPVPTVAAAAPQETEDNNQSNFSDSDDDNNNEMGIRSQQRQGSVHRMLRLGTRRKSKHRLVQAAVNGGLAFNPMVDCRICVATDKFKRGVRSSIPHRPHHPACPKNLKTRGLSAMTVFINKEAARNIAENNRPIAQPGVPPGVINAESIATFFAPRRQPTINNDVSSNERSRNIIVDSTISTLQRKKNGFDPTKIREVIDERMQMVVDRNDKYSWVRKSRFNKTLVVAIDYMMSLVAHHKKEDTSLPLPSTPAFQSAYETYVGIFGINGCVFTFPSEDFEATTQPSHFYYPICGLKMIYLDWKMIFPNLKLDCPNCHRGPLLHYRTNFSKERLLFPLFDGTGAPTLCVLMKYKCQLCNVIISANNGRLLQSLPSNIRQVYPVEPRFAHGRFHFAISASDDLQFLMRTYANAKFVSETYFRKLGLQYMRMCESYLAHDDLYMKPEPFDAWSLGFLPPSAASIRSYFFEAERSILTPYGFSNEHRYARELQSVDVGPDETLAIDWTFQVTKNYLLPKAKAVFTAMTGKTKEFVALAMVSSVALSQVTHLLRQMRLRRRNFAPTVLYTDTCPNGSATYTAILGDGLVHRLGMFHMMHRIYETMDKRSEDFPTALLELKRCFYTYNQDDEAAVLASLKDGSFSKNSHRYSDDEIADLLKTKKWSESVDPYLRKIFLTGSVIQARLKRLIATFFPRRTTEIRPVFNETTKKTIENQQSKVAFLSDPELIDMYIKVPPGPRTTHNLPKWISIRPESALEKAHEALAHMANGGMTPDNADILTLGGVSRRNEDARWRFHQNNRKIDGKWPLVPTYLEDIPPFTDHSRLDLMNKRSEQKGLGEIFDFVTPLADETGEVFLSKYFFQQEKRNETTGQDMTNHLCLCLPCRQLPVRQSTAVATAARTTAMTTTTTTTTTRPTTTTTTETANNLQNMVVNTTTNALTQIVPAEVPAPAPFFQSLQQSKAMGMCFPWYPFHCQRFLKVCQMRAQNKSVVGRKPKSTHQDHSPGCPQNFTL